MNKISRKLRHRSRSLIRGSSVRKSRDAIIIIYQNAVLAADRIGSRRRSDHRKKNRSRYCREANHLTSRFKIIIKEYVHIRRTCMIRCSIRRPLFDMLREKKARKVYVGEFVRRKCINSKRRNNMWPKHLQTIVC